MAINVTKVNTRLLNLGGGWVKAVYDTGQKDAKENAITREATITRASIELSAGVLLPKARVKAIVQAALNEAVPGSTVEIDGL